MSKGNIHEYQYVALEQNVIDYSVVFFLIILVSF